MVDLMAATTVLKAVAWRVELTAYAMEGHWVDNWARMMASK